MCGCNKGKGGCVGPNCPPEQLMGKTIVRMDLAPMSKDAVRDFKVTDLVRVEFMTIGPERAIYGLDTKRYLGRYTTHNIFFMPKSDYNEAVKRGKTSYSLIDEGFDPTVLPGIGGQMAERLRFDMNVFSKQDMINLGVAGLMSIHSTITEEKAVEILDILTGKSEPRLAKQPKKAVKVEQPA